MSDSSMAVTATGDTLNVSEVDKEEEDNLFCSACYEGDVYDGNEIVICEKCEVPVHQKCYDVPTIPDGPWFCNACEAGADTNTLTCELCPYKGGAYKQTDKDLWVHNICSNWIPEIYIRDVPEKGSRVTLIGLDKKRFKLKCSLCSGKGAGIQCAYGRCTTAAHPFCVVSKKGHGGWTKRVVKNEDDELIWEVFCKVHAAHVSEPLKPKPKARPIEEHVFDDDPSTIHTQGHGNSNGAISNGLPGTSGMHARRPHVANSRGSRLSMLHSLRYTKSVADAVVDANRSQASQSSLYKMTASSSSDALPGSGSLVRDEGMSPKKSRANSSTMTKRNNVPPEASYPTYTLSEWPGQSEGENIDLDHFWKVISQAFPEDHGPAWFKYIQHSIQSSLNEGIDGDTVLNSNGEVMELSEDEDELRKTKSTRQVFTAKTDGALQQVAPLGHYNHVLSTQELPLFPSGSQSSLGNVNENDLPEYLQDETDELLANIGGDKEKLNFLDLEKWSQQNALCQRYMHLLGNDLGTALSPPTGDGTGHDSQQSSVENQEGGDNSGFKISSDMQSSLSTDANTGGNGHGSDPASSRQSDPHPAIIGLMEENDFLVRSTAGEPPEEGRDASDKSIRAVFEGLNGRFAAHFDIDVSTSNGGMSSPNKASNGPNSDLTLHHERDGKGEQGEWAAQYVISGNDVSTQGGNSQDLVVKANLNASSVMKLDDQEDGAVYLSNSKSNEHIISKNEDDFISRMLRSNQEIYSKLASSIVTRMNALINASPMTSLPNTTSLYEETALNTKYMYGEIWKQICSNVTRGVKDQKKGFNTVKDSEEALPASWVIQVDGRPPPPAEDGANEGTEDSEDAICHVCFDGSSNDMNPILYCDGCNTAMHQLCYGVSEIPEGDFYCDRCYAVKEMLETEGEYAIDTTTAVMCCLCPVQHGGLKPTTDGRFVHLCCALFARDAVIQDMKLMAPIDVTGVTTAKVNIDAEVKGVSDRERQRLLTDIVLPAGYTDDDNDDENLPCMFCKLHGGLLVSCNYERAGGAKNQGARTCNHQFHPLCAWFAGAEVTSNITDKSFQGVEKDGAYPSGLHFTFKCLEHSSAGEKKKDSKEISEQANSTKNTSGSGSSGGNRELSTEMEELLNERAAVKNARRLQAELRRKYCIKIDDLIGVPGRKRRMRPTNKKDKVRHTNTSNNVIKEMAIDTYDKTCSCCLNPLSFLLTENGRVPGMPGKGLTAGLPPMTAKAVIEEQLAAAESADPGREGQEERLTVVKKEGDGTAMDIEGADSGIVSVKIEATTTTATTTTTTTAGAVASPISGTDMVEERSTPSYELPIKPSLLQVQRRIMAGCKLQGKDHETQLMKAREFTQKHLDDLPGIVTCCKCRMSSHLVCHFETGGELEDAVNSVAPGPAPAPAPTPAPTVVTHTAPPINVPANVLGILAAVVKTNAAVGNYNQPPSGQTAGMPSISVDPNQAKSQGSAGTEATGATATPPTTTNTNGTITSTQTVIPPSGSAPPVAPVVTPGAYMCHTCSYDITHPPCIFCPRRGGLMLPTEDGRYSHIFCANNMPGGTRVENGLVLIRQSPKGVSKQKCFVCNRKHGLCVSCIHPGCQQYFHPLCGEKSGRGYVRTRLGVITAFCGEHLPDGIERTPGGFWIDSVEVNRTRFSLERARVILEALQRREKYKRQCHLIEGKLFERRYKRRMERISAGEVDSEYDSEYTSGSDTDDDNPAKPYVHKKGEDIYVTFGPPLPDPVTPAEGDDVILEEEHEEAVKRTRAGSAADSLESSAEPPSLIGSTHFISGSFTKGTRVQLPRNISVNVAGLVIAQRDVTESDNKQHFLAELSLRSEDTKVETRDVVGLFVDARDEKDFARKLTPNLEKLLYMDDSHFKREMNKADPPIEYTPLYPGRAAARGRGNSGDWVVHTGKIGKKKTSKGYSAVDFDTESEQFETDDEAEYFPRKGVGRGRKARQAVLSDDDEVEEYKSAKKVKVSGGVSESPARRLEAARALAVSNMRVNADHASALFGGWVDPGIAQSLLGGDPLTAKLTKLAVANKRGYAGIKDLMPHPLNRAVVSYTVGPGDDKGADGDSNDGKSGRKKRIKDKSVGGDDYDDWTTFTSATLHILERRLQDILLSIEDFAVPNPNYDPTKARKASASKAEDKPKRGGRPKRGRGRGRGNRPSKAPIPSEAESDEDEMRPLIGDYREVPWQVIPDYDLYCRRLVTFDEILLKLKLHQYYSLSALERDFYELLNNGRNVTSSTTQTWADTQRLATLFTELKTANQPLVKAIHSPEDFTASPTPPKSGAPIHKQKCSECTTMQHCTGWPFGNDSSALPPPEGADWYCPTCLSTMSLKKRAVAVYWSHDGTFYHGIINAYDPISGKHRVLYADGEWEFLYLPVEVLFFPAQDDTPKETKEVKIKGRVGRPPGKKKAKMEKSDDKRSKVEIGGEVPPSPRRGRPPKVKNAPPKKKPRGK